MSQDGMQYSKESEGSRSHRFLSQSNLCQEPPFTRGWTWGRSAVVVSLQLSNHMACLSELQCQLQIVFRICSAAQGHGKTQSPPQECHRTPSYIVRFPPSPARPPTCLGEVERRLDQTHLKRTRKWYLYQHVPPLCRGPL